MRKLFLIPAFLVTVVCFSFKSKIGVVWEVSDKAEFMSVYEKGISWFSNNTNYKVDVRYESFSDQTSVKPYDQSQGFYKRLNNNFHSSSLGITTIQNEKVCLMIDSLNQLIVIKNTTSLNQTPFDSKEFAKLLDNVKALKKQKIENGGTLYRLEFKPNEFLNATEFIVNSRGLITRMKYYYSKEMQEDEENKNSLKGKPRMEISFSGYQTNINFNYEKEFSESSYLKAEKGKMMLKGNYKNYELKDFRFEAKK